MLKNLKELIKKKNKFPAYKTLLASEVGRYDYGRRRASLFI